MAPESNLHRSEMLPLWLRKLVASQAGALLMEVTVAVAVLGFLGTGLMASIQTGHIAKRLFEVQSLSENIIRNQMEHVFEQAYTPPPATYLTITPPAGYTVMAEALVYNPDSSNIETVRVTVFKGGQQVKAIETLRANR